MCGITWHAYDKGSNSDDFFASKIEGTDTSNEKITRLSSSMLLLFQQLRIVSSPNHNLKLTVEFVGMIIRKLRKTSAAGLQ